MPRRNITPRLNDKQNKHFLRKTIAKFQRRSNYHGLENMKLTDCILNNDRIRYNDTEKVWEFHWFSDGNTRVHRGLTCRQMAHYFQYYFQKASEPVMFKRIDDCNWHNTQTDNFMKELKMCNNQIIKENHPANQY